MTDQLHQKVEDLPVPTKYFGNQSFTLERALEGNGRTFKVKPMNTTSLTQINIRDDRFIFIDNLVGASNCTFKCIHFVGFNDVFYASVLETFVSDYDEERYGYRISMIGEDILHHLAELYF